MYKKPFVFKITVSQKKRFGENKKNSQFGSNFSLLMFNLEKRTKLLKEMKTKAGSIETIEIQGPPLVSFENEQTNNIF